MNLPATQKLRHAVVALIQKSPFLHDYVGDALRVQGVQDIVVSKACPPQEIHRDHQLGAKKAIVLAISLDGSPLGTEVVRPLWRQLSEDCMAQLAETSIQDLCNQAREAGVESEDSVRHDYTI